MSQAMPLEIEWPLSSQSTQECEWGRRTFATRLNAKGVGMRTIQKLMGHKHISTTALYCDVSDEMLRNAVELV
jgi:site-specific recombinase XerD